MDRKELAEVKGSLNRMLEMLNKRPLEHRCSCHGMTPQEHCDELTRLTKSKVQFVESSSKPTVMAAGGTLRWIENDRLFTKYPDGRIESRSVTSIDDDRPLR